ncbi:MAG: hypothetical protein GEV10_23440 [Streptosporangiales bacterium]|nr:hypothetical protein [Streptosporangiales bacterium]
MTRVRSERGESTATGRGTLSRCWHAALAVVVAASLVTQIVLLARTGADVNATSGEQPVDAGTRYARLFSYFTVESNVLVLAASVGLVLDPSRSGRLWRVLRLDALLSIVITGIVFVTLLAPIVENHGVGAWVNAGFHYVAPAAALVGWLLFGPRPRVAWSTIAWAFVWPLAWILYTFVHGAVTGWYPYPFLDVDALGYLVVVRNVAGVVVLTAVLAAAVKAVDARLPAVRR